MISGIGMASSDSTDPIVAIKLKAARPLRSGNCILAFPGIEHAIDCINDIKLDW